MLPEKKKWLRFLNIFHIAPTIKSGTLLANDLFVLATNRGGVFSRTFKLLHTWYKRRKTDKTIIHAYNPHVFCSPEVGKTRNVVSYVSGR
jgi:hypothetical protein